ncbi:MAG: HigA family addiction module antitoxin [Dehalococcoidales bacterium]
MVTKTKSYPDVAIAPGEYLAEEIEARGMTQKELAKRMGRPLNAINEIVKGKKAITAETALQLETVMPEIPARFWLNLETDYQLTKALISRKFKG